ncbi:DNA-3-methyladenine glycosylase family protein [Ornithinibacillus contaminans]|uniref:DNA-3-methyladenine glycosylase family protein n=1 Tax=Ornithinibacillus contaminans TaxID=694055 RepID=UPI00064DF4C9|nr:DNA-3-methyladenine glycosylase [Ornithinibacillus contaminans]
MNWTDAPTTIKLNPPKEFNYEECLVFLGRDDQEILYQLKGDDIYKVIRVGDELILCKIGFIKESLQVEFLNGFPSPKAREKVAAYVWEWFDLDTNLAGFYDMATQDSILKEVVPKYAGLRMIGIPDLFEALVWAILGQQINLPFAYTLKKRFVVQYGESISYNGEAHWLFPSFEKVASLTVEKLRELQFSARKAEYIIGIAGHMKNGELTKEALWKQGDYRQVKQALIHYRGIGAWSADYVMMKCLHFPNAYPIADVGLHNALKPLQGNERRPTLEELEALSEKWEGWQAYATFYLWRFLYD